MNISELAGKSAPRSILENVPRLVSAYYTNEPSEGEGGTDISFGTSGHRGSSLKKSFNEYHILAICQSICEYRRSRGICGPLFIGMDTHALSEPAMITAIEVFAANGVELRIQKDRGYTPTPVISHAILTWNLSNPDCPADGVVITPSHNPPSDGGFKYNPPSGGPADAHTTRIIQKRANEILRGKAGDVKRISLERAMQMSSTVEYDYILPYVHDLRNVVDMKAIASAGIKIGVDPLGGAGVHFWEPIAEIYGLDIEVVNSWVDPSFSFMTVDWDGKIRMDCSSSYAMAGLIEMKDRFDIAFGNDTDGDRHGIVTPDEGLMSPNHYLSVAASYLFRNRPDWGSGVSIGKTIVTSTMIDKIAKDMGRPLLEVPVGFKWFVDGLLDGSCGFGGEESAGASFLRKDGTVWTTDKDGFIMDLLAAEILAVTERDPGELYGELERRFGGSAYGRIEAPATLRQREVLKKLSPEMVGEKYLAGEPIIRKMTRVEGGAPIGGLKVITESGWFAARPSGTEEMYKIYAESFRGEDHLKRIQQEAQEIVDRVLKAI